MWHFVVVNRLFSLYPPFVVVRLDTMSFEWRCFCRCCEGVLQEEWQIDFAVVYWRVKQKWGDWFLWTCSHILMSIPHHHRRTSCDTNTILATIKIQGMGGAGAQPELTCAIVVAAETKGKLKLGQRKHVLSHFLFKFTIPKSIENVKKTFLTNDSRIFLILRARIWKSIQSKFPPFVL